MSRTTAEAWDSGHAYERIRDYLESRLAPTPAGRIELTAQAWAVRGVVR